MEIIKNQNGKNLELKLEGRLDTTTSPLLEAEIGTLDQTEDLVIDFEKLDYISSAGLRVLLAFQKKMNVNGKMTIKNVKEEVMEVFDITGFSDILNIE